MAEEPLQSQTTENSVPPTETEHSDYRFTQVHIGHPLRGFDRDQAISLGFARLAGLVDPQAQVQFMPRIPDDDLENPQALNLEGFAFTRAPRANQSNANSFTNDPITDNPAAFMLASAYQRNFQALEQSGALRKGVVADIKDWIKAVEKGEEEQFTNTKTVPYRDLRDYTAIFYALQHTVMSNQYIPDKAEAILQRTNELFDRLVSSQRTLPLREIYGKELQQYTEYLQQQREKLMQSLRANPDRLRTTRTQNGLQLTYVDVSGLDIDSGTFSVAADIVRAEKAVDTDIVMLVNDERDDDGDYLGKQIKIKLAKERKEQLRQYDLRDLAQRLSLSEKLFGAGVDITKNADYDGHEQIIGSPQWEGTQLNPEHVYIALQDYLNYERYPRESLLEQIRRKGSEQQSFEDRARAFVSRFNHTQYSVTNVEPIDAYHIAQPAIVLPFPEEVRSVTITEDELVLYEQVFTDNPDTNRQIVMAKTDVSQHPAIAQERNRHATEALADYLAEGNGPMVLESLNEMDQATLEGLSDDMLLTVFTLIAKDPVAIANIWNKDDMRFRIAGQKLPDWIANDPEQYKAAKYSFQSLPSKIDSYLTSRMQRFTAESQNSELQRAYAQAMTDILLSPVYRAAHHFASESALVAYDTHLQAVLRMLNDERFAEDIRREAAQRVFTGYGRDMSAHWRRVVQIDPNVVLPIMEQYTEQFEPILDAIALRPETLHHPIEDVPNSNSIPPNADTLRMHLAAQAAEGIKPTATVIVEIGRPIEDLLRDKGIVREEQNQQGRPIREKVYAANSVVKAGLLRLQDDERSYEEADDPKVARAVVGQVRTMADVLQDIDPTADIRIVEGGFPIPLVDELREQLMTSDTLDQATKERIVLCFYNPLKQVYYDRRLIKQKAA